LRFLREICWFGRPRLEDVVYASYEGIGAVKERVAAGIVAVGSRLPGAIVFADDLDVGTQQNLVAWPEGVAGLVLETPMAKSEGEFTKS